MTPEPNLNPVSVIAAVLALYLGPELAQVASAYSLIVVGWLIGVCIWLFDTPPFTRWQLAAGVAASFAFTLGATVTLSQAIVSNAPALLPVGWHVGQVRDWLFPVAIALPAVGHRWPRVALWLWNLRKLRLGGGQ